MTHLVVDTVGAVAADAELAGLSIDSWLSSCPPKPDPRPIPRIPDPGGPAPGWPSAATGRRPVRPRPSCAPSRRTAERWTTDSVRAVVEQTLDLARARLVTLERMAGDAAVLPALYERSWSLQGQRYLDFTNLAAVTDAVHPMPYVKDLR